MRVGASWIGKDLINSEDPKHMLFCCSSFMPSFSDNISSSFITEPLLQACISCSGAFKNVSAHYNHFKIKAVQNIVLFVAKMKMKV